MPTACHDGCTLRTTSSRCSRLVIQIVKPYTPQPLGGMGKDRLSLCRRCAPSSSGIGSVSGKDGVHLSWGARWGKKKKPAYPLGACRLLYHIFFYCFQFMFSQAMSLFNLFLNCWHITPFLNCLYLSIWYFKTVISSFLFINTSFLPMPRFGIKIFFSYNPLQRYAINMTWQNDARIVNLNYGKMLSFSAFFVTNVVLPGLKRAS